MRIEDPGPGATAGSAVPAAPVWLERVGAALVAAGRPEDLVASLLEILQELTGLESTYLTRIRWEDGVQEILASHQVGELDIAAGLVVDWSDTLCRRCLEGGEEWVDDVPDRWGDSGAARDLGIVTYVSVPVRDVDGGRPLGTLCGASSTRVPSPDGVDTRAVLTLFSHLIADVLRREQETTEAEARAAAAERRLEDRVRFTASAEHALRGPVTAVLGWGQMLQERGADLDPAHRAEAIDAIVRAGQRLRDQVTDLLREARTSILGSELEPEDVDLDHLLADAVAEQAGDEHEVAVTGSVGRVAIDPTAVWVVVEHLVENFQRHTPAGSTGTVAVDRTADVLHLRWSDDGPGFPEGLDVMAPFVTGGQGSGLGMYIVAELVTAMGGSLDLGGPPGAVVDIRIPV